MPPGSSVDPLAYFSRCLGWMRVAMPLPVLLATAHHDEAAPHLHVLLLPVKDGKHIGGAAITRPELKRLRDSFFNQVAGPLGMKREGAKVRGMVKQLVIAAVLAHSEAKAMPAVMGALWPVFVAGLHRDPTPHMLALGIDVNTLSPSGDQTSSPVGLDATPMGLHKQHPKDQALSCVGLHQQTTPASTTKLSSAMPDYRVLEQACQVQKIQQPRVANMQRIESSFDQNAVRMQLARYAQARAIARHRFKPVVRGEADAPHQKDDGLTRVRDDYCHDTSAWTD